jgi:carboxyl-terminal processing protease
MNTTDLYFNLFQNYLANKGVLLNISKNKALAKRYLTAEFARQLFDEQKYYEIILKEDAMVKAVLNRK